MAGSFKEFNAFYESIQWKRLRYQALLQMGAKCCLCGATRADGVVLHVDHIKPRSRFPHLELDITNLQILCEPCNIGKGGQDETDWRDGPKKQPNRGGERKRKPRPPKKVRQLDTYRIYRCPACGYDLITKYHMEKKIAFGQKYYYSEWDFCKRCKYIQHYERYKVFL